ncbi:hypothetical protein EMPS_02080 [Entomortierella parvispora]|uniref:DUF6589 domain-containing protein n=1 Tax=Entomortierella parvispora TaxID=205924 RepID=A0A9P3H465_9FUNG|nr:hypothetical protein EMPS_02080 [Entomortierella parvispora]
MNPSPTKRPFQFVESLSVQEIVFEFIGQLERHQVPLLAALRTLFNSTHPGTEKVLTYFYRDGGAAEVVGIWAATNKDKSFNKAVTAIVVKNGGAELNRLSKVEELRHPANAIDLDKLQTFELDFIQQHIEACAPTVLEVIKGLASVNSVKKSASTIVMICSVLLFLRSQKSNHFQMMMGLYLYSCGSPSAVVHLLSKASISVSHTSVLRALKGMTDAALEKIRKAVVDKPWYLVYDNINFASRKSDQRIDNSDSFESGTMATVVMMDETISRDDIRLSYHRLCLSDLIPGADSYGHMQAVTENALLKVLARSSKGYDCCRKSDPARDKLATVKTVAHPLPSMHIDQSSVAGNLEVLNTIMEKTLRLPQAWFDDNRKILVAGDQLTISRISTAMEYKAVDVSPFHRLQFAMPWLQLFHLEMAFCGLILQTHWGLAIQPGSLHFNTVFLKRKRVSLKDFDFHAAHELLEHTFEAIVIRVWEVYLVDLPVAAEGMSSDQLQEIVAEKVGHIVNDLISPDQDELLYHSRTNRNMALLLRHLLYYFELRAAIRAGDVGRIEESLRWITIMFQNGINNNYALELLRVHCAIRYTLTPRNEEKIHGNLVS